MDHARPCSGWIPGRKAARPPTNASFPYAVDESASPRTSTHQAGNDCRFSYLVLLLRQVTCTPVETAEPGVPSKYEASSSLLPMSAIYLSHHASEGIRRTAEPPYLHLHASTTSNLASKLYLQKATSSASRILYYLDVSASLLRCK